MFRNTSLALIAALAATLSASAQTETEAPYRVTRPAEHITCLSPGLVVSPVTSCVIDTDSGLIMVDTGLSPSMAERTRTRIVTELGRDDIRWVINTHGHFDHSGGNQVFADALIIGHDSLPAFMQAFADGREVWIERRLDWLARQQKDAGDAAPGSDEALALEERVRFNRELIDDLRNGYRSTPPALTFSDRLNLRVDELELRLIFFGRAHTDGDILIHIPALKALFTGDLFQEEVLGPSAGAQPLDVERWLAVLDLVMADGDGVQTVIGGHGLLFSAQWLDAQRRYLGELLQAAAAAKTAGQGLDELTAGLPFDGRFDFIADQFELPAEELAGQHVGVLRTLWRVGQVSAAEEIGRAARESGADAARARWTELRDDSGFYIDERELNALGYELLQSDRKVDEALAVFEINTQAFPDSWNVWDSFAEAHWWIDDRDGVESNYRKALELNPEADSARRGLSQIEGYRLDRAGETTTATTFAPGASTDLDGPFLGQQPPGTTPEVFAPGIVSTAEGFEYSIAFSPDGREIFFTRRIEPEGLNTLWVARLGETGWLAPEPAEVAAGRGANEPHVTPDGKRLYFGSQPPDGPGPGIWVAERDRDQWGEPRFHGRGMFASSTRNGDLYMWDPDAGRGGSIVHHKKTNDGWGPSEPLGGGVNQPLPGVHGWVAADGSFIVFDSYQRPGAQGGEGDLFVAFRNDDGSWGEAFNLGDQVNTPATNFCPALSPDGMYLFFATNRDIYWVSTEVIERLRPE